MFYFLLIRKLIMSYFHSLRHQEPYDLRSLILYHKQSLGQLRTVCALWLCNTPVTSKRKVPACSVNSSFNSDVCLDLALNHPRRPVITSSLLPSTVWRNITVNEHWDHIWAQINFYQGLFTDDSQRQKKGTTVCPPAKCMMSHRFEAQLGVDLMIRALLISFCLFKGNACQSVFLWLCQFYPASLTNCYTKQYEITQPGRALCRAKQTQHRSSVKWIRTDLFCASSLNAIVSLKKDTAKFYFQSE